MAEKRAWKRQHLLFYSEKRLNPPFGKISIAVLPQHINPPVFYLRIPYYLFIKDSAGIRFPG